MDAPQKQPPMPTESTLSLAKLGVRCLQAFGLGRVKTHPGELEQIQGPEYTAPPPENLKPEDQGSENANLAKSNFLAAMSHELRTPINAIVGFCEILNAPQSEMLTSESKKNYLNTIIENANHLQSMINDILDVSRFERGSFQLVEQSNDVAEIVEAALKKCQGVAERGRISIVAHLIDDVSVQGDLLRLKQIVQNLLTNAIKFSPEGSIVNIDMQRGPDLEFILAIRDAGIGMSDEDALRAFDSFVQLDEGATRRFDGMGLGLSIARRIARLHGGDVTLNGKLGIGTEAKLTLPASRISWSANKLKSKEQVAA